MCWPLLLITTWHLLLHKGINVLHSSTDIFFHSSIKLVHSSSAFLEFFSLALLNQSNFRTFSRGFMFGLWAGHSMRVTFSLERNVLTDLAVRHGALFCINRFRWLIAVLKLGTTCFFNITLNTFAWILPCNLTRGLVSAEENMQNTITLLPSNLTLLSVHWDGYRSLRLRRMNFLPSQRNRLYFDSSRKWTQSHCSSVHMTCSGQISIGSFCSF